MTKYIVNVLENVANNDIEAGYIKANVNGKIYTLIYDFGDSLCAVECDDINFDEHSDETYNIVEAINETISLV